MTAIDYNDIDVARTLLGDTVPTKGGLPAAWWITTNPDLIAAFDRYRGDFESGREGVERLAQSIGLTADDASASHARMG
ncbi:hypothetical protein ACNQR7_02780 [Mycolicibacterium senegalense]|uniref:hypothetical protein n=1 Tax=Mycolicibacterium senegalense TaxID=1796 RepID=UPI003AB017D9